MNNMIPANAAALTFTFNTSPVRVVMRNGEPWFVATDIAEVLGYATAKDAARNLPEHQKGRHNLPTLGGEQNLTIISEGGMYRLVLRSRKPEAAAFTDWVTDEVLPSIRKTGAYTAPSREPATLTFDQTAQAALQLAIHLMQASADTTTSRILYCPGTGSVQAVPNDAFVLSHDRYAQSIENGDVFPTDDQLFALINAAASAVHHRIKFRHQAASRTA